MQVVGSTLTMSASHAALERREVQERLRMWTGRRPEQAARAAPPPSTEVNLSAEAQQKSSAADAIDAAQQAVDNDPKLQLLKAILARLFGIHVSTADLRDLAGTSVETTGDADVAADAASSAPQQSAGYGIEYDYHEVRTEQEQTTFNAAGTVQTSDGRSIQFTVSLQMSRSFVERTDVSVRLGDAARKSDPLVINFAGTAAQLSDQTFTIDLNGDGRQDTAHFLAPGSGFLVFDRNGDGRITQASELFGPQTGDGFGELSSLDEDGSGWIDAGDSSYDQLQVWTRDAAGKDQLQSLQAAGVGAVSVARLATPFELKDAGNATLGAVRSTGVYLAESGQAGTVQQIDLVV